MKKTLSLLIAVVLVLGMMSMGVSANRGLSYTAQYATPVIDGVVDDCWINIADSWTNVDLPYGDAESVCSARVKVLHDDQYIYFLAECTDATIGDGDALEFYLDEDNCKVEGEYCDVSTQLQIFLNGTVEKNGASLSAAEADSVVAHAVTTSENGYILEWAFAPLSGEIKGGSVWGMEFMYNDADENGEFLNALRWNVDTAGGDVAPWQEVANFGTLTLAEYVAPVVDEPADEPSTDAPVVDDAPVAPVTADAGIVVAAVVMAAAAGVVLSKKH